MHFSFLEARTGIWIHLGTQPETPGIPCGSGKPPMVLRTQTRFSRSPFDMQLGSPQKTSPHTLAGRALNQSRIFLSQGLLEGFGSEWVWEAQLEGMWHISDRGGVCKGTMGACWKLGGWLGQTGSLSRNGTPWPAWEGGLETGKDRGRTEFQRAPRHQDKAPVG